MAKRMRRKRQAKQSKRQTNGLLIGGVIAVGVIGLFALLYVSLRGGDSTSEDLVTNFCNSNEENCIEKGDANAPITVVEISDYGCSHCRNFNLDTADLLDAQYVETGQVRWVTMPYALQGQAGVYPTLPTAVSAMCASEQGRFDAYHKTMFELQDTPLFNTPDGFVQAATELGMDVDAFTGCLADNDYETTILQNIRIASNAGVRSTPTFVINGEMAPGNLPLANFQQMIDSALGS